MTISFEHLPPLARMPQHGAKLFGVYSRADLYRKLKAKRIRAIKDGKSIYIVVASLAEDANSLPEATFGDAKDGSTN